MNTGVMADRLILDGGSIEVDAAGAVSLVGDHPAAAIVRTVLGIAATQERPIDVDMTNWSRVVDEKSVVKVGLTLGSLDRSARLLARLASSGVVPTYLGGLELGDHTVATISEYVPGSTDGWTWAVDDLVEFVGGGDRPRWPAELGRLCAGMHGVLAADGSRVRGVHGGVLRARASSALDEALAITVGAPGERLRNREGALRDAIASIPDETSAPAFDLHGDLHVGQVLRAADRYLVLDFDGDPQLTPAERDTPDFAARDVAHLMSSIELVASVAMKHVGVDDVVLAWARAAQQELLGAYREHSDVLDPAQLAGLHAEQLLRELIYAHRFLPRWQYAADAAITFRYPPADNAKEEPWMPPASSTT